MGFGGYTVGLALCGIAVVFAVLAFAVLIGFVTLVPSSFNLFLGIGMLIVALILFLYGWYLFQSSKPRGTINVHNV
jgi:high-affinity Fe2+/Pb2+ permease